MAEFAALLSASRAGDADAFAEAYAQAHHELRRLARRRSATRAATATLISSVLVHLPVTRLSGEGGRLSSRTVVGAGFHPLRR
jgi:hypothetical protein